MLCRVAEDVFWMSRYVERAVNVVRLIEVTGHLELDAGAPDETERDFWAPLLAGAQAASGSPARVESAEERHPLSAREIRQHLAFDPGNPNALVSCVRLARAAGQRARETVSSELWEALNTLYLSLVDPHARLPQVAEDDPYAFYKRVREGAQLVQGLADSTLAHDEPWHFISLGKFLERADNIARILRLQADLLTETAGAGAGGTLAGDDSAVVRWLAVLRSCGSAEAYARFYSLRVEPVRVLEFLLLNPVSPQSVRFSLQSAWFALAGIAGPGAVGSYSPDPAVRTLGVLKARIEHAAIDEVLEEGLDDYLGMVQDGIQRVSENVTRTYLREEPQPGRLVAVARAAMIMAAQQQ